MAVARELEFIELLSHSSWIVRSQVRRPRGVNSKHSSPSSRRHACGVEITPRMAGLSSQRMVQRERAKMGDRHAITRVLPKQAMGSSLTADSVYKALHVLI